MVLRIDKVFPEAPELNKRLSRLRMPVENKKFEALNINSNCDGSIPNKIEA
jgi:hypothetical protein